MFTFVVLSYKGWLKLFQFCTFLKNVLRKINFRYKELIIFNDTCKE